MKVVESSLSLVSRVGEILLELFYPLHCEVCEKALFAKTRLCQECWDRMKPLTASFCERCSYPLLKGGRCKNCADRELHFVAGVSAFQYEGLVRQLLHRFKYGGDQSLKKVLGELLALTLRDKRLQGVSFEAIVPVPLYRLREREREFNQALLLAQEVAFQLKRPLRQILCCTQATASQARLDRKERIKNRTGKFALKKNQSLSGNYLLVDDVLTTGATLDVCARVLLEAGASGVWAATVARAF